MVKEVRLKNELEFKSVKRELAIMKRLGGRDHFLQILRTVAPEHYDKSTRRVLIMMEAADSTLKDGVLALDFDEVSRPTRIRLLVDLLRGVKAMHDNGFVHRDLKPANLLIMGDCQEDSCHLSLCDLGLKVGDFGLSFGLEGTDEIFQLSERERQHLAGTRLYLPPEVLSGKPVTPGRQDSYAVGLIICETAFGLHPKSFDDWSAYILAVEQARGINFAEDLEAQRLLFLGRSLTASEPEERFSIAAALGQLEQLLANRGAEAW